MELEALSKLLPAIGIPTLIVAGAIYLIINPEKGERVAGWIWGALSRVRRRWDAKAVKYKVAGAVNDVLRKHKGNWPKGLVEGDLRIEWTNGEEAEARLERGEVVVFMQQSRRQAENVTNAVLAFLPRAVAPRARRYVEPDTMRAADLTMAKGLLCDIGGDDALKMLFDNHLDPAAGASTGLRERLEHMDDVDVHGWLTRILLVELKRLADKVHPGRPTKVILHEAERFVDWLHTLAVREHGSQSENLFFEGRYLRIAIVLVANRSVLERKGTDPYRKTAKRYIYKENVDAVYLLSRDDNNHAVRTVCKNLGSDGRVADIELLKYDLRADFQVKHNLLRTTAVIARLTRHRPRTAAEAALDAMHDDHDEERYVVPAYEEEIVETKADAEPDEQRKAA